MSSLHLPSPHSVSALARAFAWAGAITLLSAAHAGALEVAPGDTSPPLQAEGCDPSSGGPFGDCVSGCIARCDLPDNAAEAYLDVSNFAAGSKFAEATVFTEFIVTASAGGGAARLGATVSYDVEWAGGWTIDGVFTGWNDALSTVTLSLHDETAGSTVQSVVLHRMDVDGFIGIDLLDVGFGLDRGSAVSSLTTQLTRGHTYRLALTIRCQAKGRANATVFLDYMTGEWGVRWNDLKVTIAPDLAEEIEKLKKRVAALEDHTHTYLTGIGVGHNNTEAQTSQPILVDVADATPQEVAVLPDVAGAKRPMPMPSVFLKDGPNPTQPTTTISFTLPEPLFVSIQLFDVQGQVARTLLSEHRAAGRNSIPFDGAGLASGVYYYRLVAGPFSETRKLTLIK